MQGVAYQTKLVPFLNMFMSRKQIGILKSIVLSVASSLGDVTVNRLITAELPVVRILELPSFLPPSVGFLGTVASTSSSVCSNCISFVSTGG